MSLFLNNINYLFSRNHFFTLESTIEKDGNSSGLVASDLAKMHILSSAPA